ncbi:MAG: amino acid adenylation domain-containing protein [Anaerolineales bacterium]|nr:amino acid adenylation domain-containing protein [Anaerolineales bacterium]
MVPPARRSPAFGTLVEMLRSRAADQPERLAYRYLPDDAAQLEQSVTFGELDRQARAIAAWLQASVPAGSRALLLFPPGLEYIAAYFGCLHAGVIAVPAYPPRVNRPMPRLQSIVADAEATVALTTTSILITLERRFAHMSNLAALRWLDTAQMPAGLESSWISPDITPATLAFLQYTSGSTSSPKGVMVSHGNLMHNLDMIQHGFQMNNGEAGVFWLPSYHDMGLIGGILEPMYLGGTSTLMSPASFLQRPVRWLEMISQYRGTISGAPNFAYALCAEKVSAEQRAALDLSSWVTAFCGAEPIRRDALDNFAAAFAPCGFNPKAFYPCYGLAEATLLVAGGYGSGQLTALTVDRRSLAHNQVVLASEAAAPQASETSAQVLVSSGQAVGDQQIVIVNPETLAARPEAEVGEIWLRGPNVTQGYWRRPEATVEAFAARLADGAGPFLRTGDLGFLLAGNLYVTGRAKDLIIIRGRNHYPQDIEATVERCHPGLRAGSGAAFSVDAAGEERLVVVFEVERHHKPDLAEVVAAVRRALAVDHELQLHALVLIKTLSIPKTSSGKIQRHACKAQYLEGTLEVVAEWQADPATSPTAAAPVQLRPSGEADAAALAEAGRLEAWLAATIAARLNLAPAAIDRDTPFVEYGLDSAQAVGVAGELGEWLGRSVPPTLAWDYPTVGLLARHLAGLDPSKTDDPALAARAASAATGTEPIAIIGLGCRFPGAPNPAAFWQLLINGVDAIQEVPADRWLVDAHYDPTPGARGKMNTRWGGFLDNVDQFDAHFFGISPREAARMDPQQRLLLEVAWEALEAAHLPPERLAGSAAGVFVGISSYDYSRLQFDDPDRIDAYAGTGNAHSIAANRLSYLLDLRGPSLAIDTACSSSLVAVHMACQSLRSGESQLAIAAGVNLILAPELTITFAQARMLAPDGRCKTFDAAADGYARGEGCGVVILKRLADARRDGDAVAAVIHGSAVNQDGRSNGLTAPNGLAQQAAIRAALQQAGVTPGDLNYVEAHGTGTPLGDPIEVQALAAVIGPARDESHPIGLGSVKTNIGHLEAAAGIAGLIKVVLALQNEALPPHLHLRTPNPHLPLAGTPLRIVTQVQPWPRSNRPRLAGVSSFGFGGTNAHVVLGEAPTLVAQPSPTPGERPVHVLTLSARSRSALQALAGRCAEHLARRPEHALADAAFSANTGRSHYLERLAIIAADRAEALAALHAAEQGASHAGLIVGSAPNRAPRRVAFLFTGQGAQYAGMARQLYATQPTFRRVLDRCAAWLEQRGLLARPLLPVIWGEGEAVGWLDQTAYTQPALFAVELALAELWQAWGVEPAAVLGHSVGEYAAAVAAGAMSLEDGLTLIAARGRLMQALPAGGAMASVFAPESVVADDLARFSTDVALAALNGRESTVISGTGTAVEAVLAALQARGVKTRRLNVSHAFHSPLMAPMQAEFEREARALEFAAPCLPLISNVTGQLLTTAPDAPYWRDHVRAPVQFARGMESLAALGIDTFIEIGPQPVLLGMGRRCLQNEEALWLPSLRPGQADWRVLAHSLGLLYTRGAPVDWAGFDHDYARLKLSLPSYPFERSRYWLSARKPPAAAPAPSPADEASALRTAVDFLAQVDPAQLRELGFRLERVDPQAQTAPQAAGAVPLFGRAALAALPHDERPTALRSLLARELGQVLGLGSQPVDAHRPLNLLGLDSLMAVELKNRIERALELEVHLVELLEGPTLTELARRLNERLDGPRAHSQRIPGGAEPVADHPLTPNQQALWFLHQLVPPGIGFNVAGAARLHGPLKAAALEGALNQLAARHPMLRAQFGLSAGLPIQRAQVELKFVLAREEAREWTHAQLQAHLAATAYAPFDLDHGPLLRACLYHINADEHILLLSLDHIVTDFWSMSVLITELARLYEAESTGQSRAWDPLPITYADFARWQAERLAGDEGERLWAYWKQKLEGALPVLDLPTDRPRPAAPSYQGDVRSARYGAALTERLKSLGQAHGATLFMTLLAAFEVLLYRYSGQSDLIVGSVTSGRSRPELSGLVGYFVNPIPLRTQVDGQQPFTVLLGQVRRAALDAFEHADFPPAWLAERLHLLRDTSRPPLFQVMFILQKPQMPEAQGLGAFALGLPGGPFHLGHLTLEAVTVQTPPAQFDLTLMMAEVEGGLAAALFYSTDLFEAATIDRMLGHLGQALHSIVADPNQPVATISLMTPAEEREMLQAWNGTTSPLPAEQDWLGLIEGQARRVPAAMAVEAAEHNPANGNAAGLTYAALDREANQLARFLNAQGIGPGALVGVCVERTPRMLVALLGILKSGAAYLPLDPSYPPERLAFMLADSGAALVLTETGLVGQVPDFAGRTLALDEAWPQISSQPGSTLRRRPLLDECAYTIYTSGSTGQPKGVQVPHRALTNFLLSMQTAPGLTEADRLLAVTTLSFDIAGLELYLPLVTGARVVLASRETAADGEALAAALARHRITVMQATPATWRLLLAGDWPGRPGLNAICGGEALPQALAQALAERCDQVWNLYGPTETTIWSTAYRVYPGQEAIGATVPIGRPIANTQAYVLDERQRPVPPGVVGELYLGGLGVALGYLNRPELTSERFVPDPFSPHAGARLYRTGDLARRLGDGSLQYLGRADQQIKLRGFRIELGEIEAALAHHPAVSQAAVALCGTGPDKQRLVGYVVPAGGQPGPDGAALRAFARQRLPEYMLPVDYVVLDALPLTPNGKLDRKALPPPPEAASSRYIAPRTATEAAIAALWAEILGLGEEAAVTRIGVEDSFFELGGHSLLATRLSMALRETFGVRLPLRAIFETPTIAGLALAIDHARTQGAHSHSPGRLFTPITMEQLAAEAILPASIQPGDTTPPQAGEPAHLFLTGATGFLGAFLLHDLLATTPATVHCLVRATDAQAGRQRLRANLAAYGVWEETYASRIEPVLGDLAEPLLGLSEPAFAQLASLVDTIYHNGAMVNFVHGYAAHKPANVLGTQAILQLAVTGRIKPVHFVSTLSVFHTATHTGGQTFREDDELVRVGVPYGGYAQSKWVSEQLMLQAAARGLPVAIYRPGPIAGHSQTGAWNTTDFIGNLTSVCLSMNAVPHLDLPVDIVPVDYVSASIVALARRSASPGRVFHLCNPQPMPFGHLVDWARSHGYALRSLPFDAWQSELLNLAARFPASVNSPFLPLIEDVTLDQVFMPRFDCRNTLAGLAGTGVRCPPLDAGLLDHYLNTLLRSGLAPRPAAPAPSSPAGPITPETRPQPA